MRENYDIIEYIPSTDKELRNKMQEYIAKSCLKIANDAQFPTDYQDVYDHLFEDDTYLRLFVVEKESQCIKGFAIACLFEGYNGVSILHIHGIIMHPDIQGLGLSKDVTNYAIRKYNPDVLTAKTHNPRCFNAFANVSNGTCKYYPNGKEMPDIILKIAHSDRFISVVDDDLIYRNAYPDIKIMQSNRDKKIDNVFSKLNDLDAQAIVVVLNNEIFKQKGNKELVL